MAGNLQRPWFRLGSMTRPTTGTTTAQAVEQPRPVPTLIRPPLIRPPAVSEPAEHTSPKQSAKSPPQLPRPASLTPPVKKAASPPAPTVTRPVLPSPSNAPRVVTPAESPVVKQPSTEAKSSPTNEESFDKNNIKQPSPILSPLVPKSIPAVSSPYHSPKPKAPTSPPSPPPSPKSKATTSPPSPLVLPPSQLKSVAEPKHETIPQEVERKTVVFQKVMDKPSQPEHRFTNYHNPGFVQNGKQEPNKHDEEQSKEKGIRAKKTFVASDDKDTNTRVITMAGENRGAFMEVVLSDKNNNSRHHQIRQSNESQNEDTIETAKDSRSKNKSVGTRNVVPMKAFFNSNVQGINNSILMDSKFTHHDPGIHLVFSRMPPSTDEKDDQGQQ